MVVARRQAGRGEVGRVVLERPVEERLPLVTEGVGGRVVVDAAARLRRPVVVAVRPGRGHQRAVEAVEDRERLARGVNEAEIALVVVTEGEFVVVALEEPVRLRPGVRQRASQLLAAARPGVVGIWMTAALPLALPQVGGVARGDEGVAVVGIRIGPALDRIRIRQPAEVVVERPVLHH